MKASRKVILLGLTTLVVAFGAKHALGGGSFGTSTSVEEAAGLNKDSDDVAEITADVDDSEASPDVPAPSTHEVLSRLVEYERALLDDDVIVPAVPTPGEPSHLDQEIERLRSELEESRTEAVRHAEETRSLRAKLSAVRDSSPAPTQQSEADKVKHQEAIRALESEKRGLESRQDEYINQIVALNKQLKELTRTAEAKSQAQTDRSAEVASLTGRLQLAESEIETLRPQAEKITALEADRDRMRKRFDKLLSAAKRLDSELDQQRDMVQENVRLREQLAQFQGGSVESAGLRAERDELNRRLELVSSQRDELLRDVDQTKDRLTRMAQDYESSSKRRDTELAKLQGQYEKARGLLKDIAGAKEQFEADLVRLQSELKSTEQERNDLRTRTESLRAETVDSEARLDKLTAKLEKANAALRIHEERIPELEQRASRVENLESEVSTCKNQLPPLKAQAQQLEQLQSELVRARSDRTRAQNQLLLRETEISSISGRRGLSPVISAPAVSQPAEPSTATGIASGQAGESASAIPSKPPLRAGTDRRRATLVPFGTVRNPTVAIETDDDDLMVVPEQKKSRSKKAAAPDEEAAFQLMRNSLSSGEQPATE